MSTVSPILGLAQVATNQNNKETTINSAFAQLEASLNSNKLVDFTSGDVTMNALDYGRYIMYNCTNASANHNLFIPASVRFFFIRNPTSYVITVTVTPASGGSSFAVAAGHSNAAYCDGANVYNLVNATS